MQEAVLLQSSRYKTVEFFQFQFVIEYEVPAEIHIIFSDLATDLSPLKVFGFGVQAFCLRSKLYYEAVPRHNMKKAQ